MNYYNNMIRLAKRFKRMVKIATYKPFKPFEFSGDMSVIEPILHKALNTATEGLKERLSEIYPDSWKLHKDPGSKPYYINHLDNNVYSTRNYLTSDGFIVSVTCIIELSYPDYSDVEVSNKIKYDEIENDEMEDDEIEDDKIERKFTSPIKDGVSIKVKLWHKDNPEAEVVRKFKGEVTANEIVDFLNPYFSKIHKRTFE